MIPLSLFLNKTFMEDQIIELLNQEVETIKDRFIKNLSFLDANSGINRESLDRFVSQIYSDNQKLGVIEDLINKIKKLNEKV